MDNIIKLLPLISSIFVLALGIIVFVNGKRNQLNILFLVFSFIIFAWLSGTFMMLKSHTTEEAFFWDKLIYVAVIFIPSTVYHFAVIFAEKFKKRKMIVIVGYIFSLIFLLLNLFTKLFVNNVYEYSWGIHSKAQIFHHFFLIFFIVYLVLMFNEIIVLCRSNLGILRQKARTEFLALLVLTTGSVGFLPAYGVNVPPIFYLSGLFFAIITGYAITQYKLLKIKVLTLHALIILLNVVAFSYIFISETIQEYIVKMLFFVAVAFTSYLLKKSFDQEVAQKEKLKFLAKKLKKTNEKLIALDDAKNEFVSIAAHQLRTPPTIIKGYVSMALEEGGDNLNEKIKDYLKRTLVSNERLIELVEDILDISRIESGRIQYNFEDNQDCRKIVDEVYKSFEMRAKEKGLKLILKKTETPLPKIKMDSKRIREVLSNLVDNAIKYTRKGKITIEEKNIDNKKVRISVSDTGVGILKKDMPNLFKKFSRGTSTERLGSEGTGLGIYVGRKMVKIHHGKIWAESKGINKGSKFVMELPVKWKE